MSLRVWLPMTKDLRNQGLDDVTVTNNGATFNSAGKLGGCYYFNGSGYLKETSFDWTNFNTSEFSLCCWYKEPSPVASGNSQMVCIGTSSGWNNIRIGLLRRTSNGYPMFSVSDGTNNVNYNFTADSFALDAWNHIVCTYNNGTMKMYLNGILHKTYTTTITPLLNSSQHLGVGAASNGSEPLVGYLNDVRIYDHCLSPMEVKELAKGLVLHYPLNGNNETLVPFGYQQLEYIESSGSSYFNTGYKFNPETDACKVEFKGNDVSNDGMIFADSGGKYFWFYYYGVSGIRVYADNGTGQQGISGIPSDLNKHIAEYKNKHYYIDGVDKGSLSKTYTEDTNTIWLFSYGGDGYPFKGRIYYTDIKRNDKIQKIYIPAKRISDSAIGMYELITNQFFTSASTAFTAGPVVGTPSITYDTSGFCNNGTISGTLAVSNDTPKYKVSTHFSSAQIKRDSLEGEIKTLACWVKTTANKSTSQFVVADYNSNMCISFYSGCIIGVFGPTRGTGSKSTLGNSYKENDWNHIVVVKTGDAGERAIYCNGVLLTPTTNDYWSKAAGFLVSGCNTSNTLPMQGYISDVRAYATALSADDVKSLYQNCAYIDSSGNVYGTIHES